MDSTATEPVPTLPAGYQMVPVKLSAMYAGTLVLVNKECFSGNYRYLTVDSFLNKVIHISVGKRIPDEQASVRSCIFYAAAVYFIKTLKHKRGFFAVKTADVFYMRVKIEFG